MRSILTGDGNPIGKTMKESAHNDVQNIAGEKK